MWESCPNAEIRRAGLFRPVPFLKLIVTAAINIVTFIAIDAWMVSTGVNSTIAGVIAGVAVFGEVVVSLRIRL